MFNLKTRKEMIIIQKPVITEKMTAISEKLNRYAFIVDKRANKIQIKKAVEDQTMRVCNTRSRWPNARRSRLR